MILTHGSDPNQVALTFDDGPNGDTTLEILSLLHLHNAKATFFMLGKYVETNPYVVRAVAGAGHEIGNHTFSHPSTEYGDYEILACDEALESAGVKAPDLFRPPYGNVANDHSHTFGLTTVLWSQLSGDWVAKSPEEILEKVNLDTDKGEIVLLHDGAPDKLGADRSNTVKAVEMILQKWPNKQYVTVSELTI